jgi:hypothetical protein
MVETSLFRNTVASGGRVVLASPWASTTSTACRWTSPPPTRRTTG